MFEYQLTAAHVQAYRRHLQAEERSTGTIEKYLRDIAAFLTWLEGKTVTKDLAAAWKGALLTAGYAPGTVNGMVCAINGLFHFLGWDECRVKFLKVQRKLFRDPGRELTQREYDRLHESAQTMGKERLALMMETICATGIRVSEVRAITVEAARQGKAEISLKGKIRLILLPVKLCRKLLKYARRQKTASGAIFRTKSGKELSRHQIWAELKRLCQHAGVAPSKVFPHNLRHLFARMFYQTSGDIVRLADVLGHSSIETTRIYLITSGDEHRRQLERLGLVT